MKIIDYTKWTRLCTPTDLLVCYTFYTSPKQSIFTLIPIWCSFSFIWIRLRYIISRISESCLKRKNWPKSMKKAKEMKLILELGVGIFCFQNNNFNLAFASTNSATLKNDSLLPSFPEIFKLKCFFFSFLLKWLDNAGHYWRRARCPCVQLTEFRLFVPQLAIRLLITQKLFSGKGRTKKESAQHTNQHDPGGHTRKTTQKLINSHQKEKEQNLKKSDS